MRIGVPREVEPGERRVALVPEAVSKLVASGFEVVVERGAGAAAPFPDEAYREAGAELADQAWDADAVVKVRKPTVEETQRLRNGQVLIGFLEPLTDPAGVELLAERGVQAFVFLFKAHAVREDDQLYPEAGSHFDDTDDAMVLNLISHFGPSDITPFVGMVGRMEALLELRSPPSD